MKNKIVLFLIIFIAIAIAGLASFKLLFNESHAESELLEEDGISVLENKDMFSIMVYDNGKYDLIDSYDVDINNLKYKETTCVNKEGESFKDFIIEFKDNRIFYKSDSKVKVSCYLFFEEKNND